MKCGEFTALIDGYLAGAVPEEQQEAFELHYFECDGCFAQLKAAERLHSKEVPIAVAMRDSGRAARPLFGFLGDLLAPKPVMAMATVLVVALVSVLMLQQSGDLAQLKEIATFSPPPYVSIETRTNGAQTNVDRTFHEAMTFYRNKDYRRALALLEGLTQNARAHNPQFTFYKGICLFALDRVKESIAAFDVIIGNMNPSYYDEALYYKSIALVHLGKTGKALELLRILSDMYSPLSHRAKKMIEDISARL